MGDGDGEGQEDDVCAWLGICIFGRKESSLDRQDDKGRDEDGERVEESLRFLL